jgi:hypothetical protein
MAILERDFLLRKHAAAGLDLDFKLAFSATVKDKEGVGATCIFP